MHNQYGVRVVMLSNPRTPYYTTIFALFVLQLRARPLLCCVCPEEVPRGSERHNGLRRGFLESEAYSKCDWPELQKKRGLMVSNLTTGHRSVLGTWGARARIASTSFCTMVSVITGGKNKGGC